MYVITTHFKEDAQKMADYRTKFQYVWAEHLLYLRNTVICISAKSPDAESIKSRFINNQADIASSAMYAQLTDKLAAELKINASMIVDYVTAMTNKVDPAAIKITWASSLDTLASTLSSINQWHIPKAQALSILTTYMQQIVDMVSARFANQWEAEINACDSLHKTICDLADTIAHGVIINNIDQFSVA